MDMERRVSPAEVIQNISHRPPPIKHRGPKNIYADHYKNVDIGFSPLNASFHERKRVVSLHQLRRFFPPWRACIASYLFFICMAAFSSHVEASTPSLWWLPWFLLWLSPLLLRVRWSIHHEDDSPMYSLFNLIMCIKLHSQPLHM